MHALESAFAFASAVSAVALATFAWALYVAAPASAQPPTVSSETTAGCQPNGSSRARRDCDPSQVVVTVEQNVTFSIEAPTLIAPQCSATIEIRYSQRNTLANVEGTIAHADCAASTGEYKITATVRDEKLDVKALEFVEAWQRNDDRPVTLRADYPIGENVDLLRVRARETRCTCVDTLAAPAAAP